MKKLHVNAGSVLLLNDRNNTLDQYEKISFNAGSVVATSALYASVASKGQFNAGSTHIIDTTAEIVYHKGLFVADGSELGNVYLVCDSLHVLPGADKAMAKLAGGTVFNAIYKASSVDSACLAKLTAKNTFDVADDAILRFDSLRLTGDAVSSLVSGGNYFVNATVYASDEQALATLRKNGIHIACKELFIAENLLADYAQLFTAEKLTTVPAGFAIVKDGDSLLNLYANHGDKIYLLGGLSIQSNDEAHLDYFEKIIACKRVSVPLALLAKAKKVISCDKFRVYEGELLDVEGFQTISHDMLSAASAAGIRYTLQVNGFALFNEDVTTEDIKAIASISVNGAISAPSALHAHLSQVSTGIDGMMMGSIPEIKALLASLPEGVSDMAGAQIPPQMAQLFGMDGDKQNDDLATINTGSYVLA